MENSGTKRLNAELNPICHLLVLLGAHPILHISRIRVNRYTKWFYQQFIVVFIFLELRHPDDGCENGRNMLVISNME